MPQFNQVSAKEVMARIIRNTGYRLPSVYHDDILEWIPEAIGMLQVTRSMEKVSTPDCGSPGEYRVKNHMHPLPCGFQGLDAVEDENGRVIPEGGDITDLRRPTTQQHRGLAEGNSEVRPTVFNVNPLQHQTQDGTPTTKPGSTIPLYGTDLEKMQSIPSEFQYYKISGNYIQTSFEEGFIKLHYWTIPVCSEGYPLIPDNENFKQAIYWYVLSMLIGAGYQHKVFSFDQAFEYWEKYANRAVNEVSYPSISSMHRLAKSSVRLIPPINFYEDFFIGSEFGERLNK